MPTRWTIMDLEQLIAEIFDAWRDVAYPGDDNILLQDAYGEEDIADYLRGRDQSGHQPADLRACSAGFTFFTPSAWHYWLPSFMVANLQYSEESDVCVERLAHSLYDDYASSRLGLLSETQRKALIRYLRYRLAQPDTTAEEKTAFEQFQ